MRTIARSILPRALYFMADEGNEQIRGETITPSRTSRPTRAGVRGKTPQRHGRQGFRGSPARAAPRRCAPDGDPRLASTKPTLARSPVVQSGRNCCLPSVRLRAAAAITRVAAGMSAWAGSSRTSTRSPSRIRSTLPIELVVDAAGAAGVHDLGAPDELPFADHPTSPDGIEQHGARRVGASYQRQ